MVLLKVEQLKAGDEFTIDEKDQTFECVLVSYQGMNKYLIEKNGSLELIDGKELVIKK